jgi:chemotaxis signal transduction protein
MSTIKPPQLLQQLTEPQSCQAIVFQIAERWLALPHTALLRVVHQPTLSRNGHSDQLVYLGKQPLSIVDLRPLLTAVHDGKLSAHNQSTVTEAPFLIIAAVDTTPVGIPVDQSPVLLELPLTAAKALPPAYYNAIGGISSHVVAVPKLGAVLLLNLSTVIQGS